MTQPRGNRRPEADVIPLVSFPFRRSVVAACAQTARNGCRTAAKTRRDRCHGSGLTCADVGPARSVNN